MKNFMNNGQNEFIQEFERYKKSVLMNREDYSILITERNRIMNDFPNVEKFLVDGEIIDISDDDKDTILKVLDLDESIKEIEYQEIYKLGGQNAYIHLEKMGMIQINTY